MADLGLKHWPLDSGDSDWELHGSAPHQAYLAGLSRDGISFEIGVAGRLGADTEFRPIATVRGRTVNPRLSVQRTSPLLSFQWLHLKKCLSFILCVYYHHPEIATVNIFQIRLNFISLPMEFTSLLPGFPCEFPGHSHSQGSLLP